MACSNAHEPVLRMRVLCACACDGCGRVPYSPVCVYVGVSLCALAYTGMPWTHTRNTGMHLTHTRNTDMPLTHWHATHTTVVYQITYMHTYMHTLIHPYTPTCITHTHTHTHTHAHTNARTTQTQTSNLQGRLGTGADLCDEDGALGDAGDESEEGGHSQHDNLRHTCAQSA